MVAWWLPRNEIGVEVGSAHSALSAGNEFALTIGLV